LLHYSTQLVLVIALLYTLTPSVPLSLEGEGEDNKKEGLPPLLDAPLSGRILEIPKNFSLFSTFPLVLVLLLVYHIK